MKKFFYFWDRQWARYLDKSYGRLGECPQFVAIRTFFASSHARCFWLGVDFWEGGKAEHPEKNLPLSVLNVLFPVGEIRKAVVKGLHGQLSLLLVSWSGIFNLYAFFLSTTSSSPKNWLILLVWRVQTVLKFYTCMFKHWMIGCLQAWIWNKVGQLQYCSFWDQIFPIYWSLVA